MAQTWDPALPEDSATFRAAVVVLAALYVGCDDLGRLARATGVRRGLSGIARNLRASGVWTPDGRTVAGRDDPGGEIAFRGDVTVALGYATKRRE